MKNLVLEDLCELVVDCKNRTPPEVAPGEEPAGYAIGTPHIINGRISLANAKKVSRNTFDTWTARAVPQEGDVVLTREAPVGRVGRVEEGMKICLGQRTMLLRPDAQRTDSRYLHYLLLSSPIQDRLHSQGSGSTVAHLRVSQVRELRIPEVPTLGEQRRIGAALGALDDKITINKRIATAAEEITLAIASSMRWDRRVRLGEICSLRKEQCTPQELDVDVVDHYSLPAYDAEKTADHVSPASIKSAKFMIPEAAILLSKLNPEIPRVWNVEPDEKTLALASTEFLVLTPILGVSTHQLWAVAAQHDFRSTLASRVTGTSKSHQRVRPTEALATEVVDPRQLGEEGQQIDSLAEKTALVRKENRTLAALRDNLLPQLVSGRLHVRDAEKIVEDHA